MNYSDDACCSILDVRHYYLTREEDYLFRMLTTVCAHVYGISHLLCATSKHLADSFYYRWLHILRDLVFALTEELFPVILDLLDDLAPIVYISVRCRHAHMIAQKTAHSKDL